MLEVTILGVVGHPARASRSKATGGVNSRPQKRTKRDTSYVRDNLNDDFSAKGGGGGQQGRGCTADMNQYLDGIAEKGESSGKYTVKRKRGTDFCVSQPEEEVTVKRDGDGNAIEIAFYLSKRQIQDSSLEICDVYTDTFVDGSIGAANLLVSSLQVHSTAVVADCTTKEATRLAKTIGIASAESHVPCSLNLCASRPKSETRQSCRARLWLRQ